MSRKRKSPEERLLEIIEEIGLPAVRAIIRLIVLMAEKADGPQPRPKTQPRAVSASKKAIAEEVKP